MNSNGSQVAPRPQAAALFLAGLSMLGARAVAQAHNPEVSQIHPPSVAGLELREIDTYQIANDRGDIISNIGIYVESLAPQGDGPICAYHSPANIISKVEALKYQPGKGKLPDGTVSDIVIGQFGVTAILSSADIREGCAQKICAKYNLPRKQVSVSLLPIKDLQGILRIGGTEYKVEGALSVNKDKAEMSVVCELPAYCRVDDPDLMRKMELFAETGVIAIGGKAILHGFIAAQMRSTILIRNLVNIWDNIKNRVTDDHLSVEDQAKIRSSIRSSSMKAIEGTIPAEFIPAVLAQLKIGDQQFEEMLLQDNGQRFVAAMRSLDQKPAEVVAVKPGEFTVQRDLTSEEKTTTYTSQQEQQRSRLQTAIHSTSSKVGGEIGINLPIIKFGVQGEFGTTDTDKTEDGSMSKEIKAKIESHRQRHDREITRLDGRQLEFNEVVSALGLSEAVHRATIEIRTPEKAYEFMASAPVRLVTQAGDYEADLRRQNDAPRVFYELKVVHAQLWGIYAKLRFQEVALERFRRLQTSQIIKNSAEEFRPDPEVANFLGMDPWSLSKEVIRTTLERGAADITSPSEAHEYLAAVLLITKGNEHLKAITERFENRRQLFELATQKDPDLLRAVVTAMIMEKEGDFRPIVDPQ